MTTELEQSRASRLPSLTGLRWIAALLVFALHATYQTTYVTGPVGKLLGDTFARSGFYAVSFFFLLSGFVLTWSARPGDRARRIWRRRLVKIYPTHLVTFGIAAVLMLIAADTFTTKGVLANLFLIQTWFPNIPVSRSMNQISWSLACEAFFYLCFPLLLWLLNRIPTRRLWTVAGVLAVLIVAAPAVSHLLVGGTPLPRFPGGPVSFEQIWFVYLFPPIRALEFILGMVIARVVRSGAWPRIGLLPSAVIAFGGYVVYLKVPYLYGVGGTAALWLVPLVAAAASADVQGTWSPFRGKILVRLGDLSFAFYMVQGMVLAYGWRWLVAGQHLPPGTGAAVLVGLFALCLALSYLLYTRVEQPMTRKFNSARGKQAPSNSSALPPVKA